MNEKQQSLKYLVQGPGVQKNLSGLSSHTPGYSLKSCPGHGTQNINGFYKYKH